MPVKTTGAEWKRFYADKEFWPDEAWHEDEEVIVNGLPTSDDFDLSAVHDTDVLVVGGGIVFLPDLDMDRGPSLEAHFKRWRKTQNTVSVIVEVDKTKFDAVAAAIKAAGGKVVGQ